MLFMDFWGDNPFADLDLAFPPLPSSNELSRKIKEKKTFLGNLQRKLSGRSDPQSIKETKEAEARTGELNALQKKLNKKLSELKEALPFDTLLCVQAIAPVVFSQKSARAPIVAQAWGDIWEGDDMTLSDTQRTSFKKDFTRNPLLDDA